MAALAQRATFVAALAVAPCAWAAGGHHGVDDASLMDTGQCELESWFTRERGGKLVHSGLDCRVGPVEIGALLEYQRAQGASRTGQGVQVKWAREFGGGFSVGASAGANWEAHQRPRYQGTTVSTLFSWVANDKLSLHANIGRDFLRGQPDVPRSGVSVEWFPFSPSWRLEVERYVEDETQFARGGLRWLASDRWTVDLSRAQSLRGPRPSNWTLGATFAFAR
jgi:hypothetical protein